MRTLAILAIFAATAFGQRHKAPAVVDAEKPEGKLLQQAMQESDPAKKNALMEQSANENLKAENAPWVIENIQAYYVKAGQPDAVIAWGDKLLSVDPDDPEPALQALKAAETKKDPALIRKYGEITARNAQKLASAPQSKEADAASWKADVDYARQVGQYAEYALFLAYRQTGANDKAIELAEKTLATEQKNEDMLLVVSDYYLQQKKEPEKIHAYCSKVVEIMSAKPKPEGMSDADWNTRKNAVLGLAYFISGKEYSAENKHPQTDQQLRKALPLVESTPALKAETLFLLGLANYRMAGSSPERAQDSANFFRACSAIKSPFQAQAGTNLKKIMTEYHGIK